MTAIPYHERLVSVDIGSDAGDETVMTIFRGQQMRYVGPPLAAWHIGQASGALRASGRSTRAAQRALDYVRAGYNVLFVGPDYQHAKYLRIRFCDLAEEQLFSFSIAANRTKLGAVTDSLAENIEGLDPRRWRVVFDHTADIDERLRDLLLAKPEYVDCPDVPRAAIEKRDGYMLPTLALVLMDGEVEWSSWFAGIRAFVRRSWWYVSARWGAR